MATNSALGAVTILLTFTVSLPAADAVRAQAVAPGQQPQVALSGDGVIHLTFGAGESVFYTRSADRGRTFREPVKLGDVPRLALGMRRGPRIVAGDKSVVISAIGHQQGNVVAWRSEDGGDHWSGPARVNDADGKAIEGLHAMTIGPQGQIFCTWLDLRQQGTQLWSALSKDGGQTWEANRQVYASPSGSICECCHPSATYGPDGTLHVMWRNSMDGYRDMFIASSSDDGRSFSEARKLGQGSWKLAACPMDGGHLAVESDGQVTTVWRRDRQVYRTDGSGDEVLLGTGQQPWAAAAQEGVYLVWVAKRDGELQWSDPRSSQSRTLASHARDPVIAVPPSGQGPVIVFWETEDGGVARVMAAVVSS